MVGSPSPKCFLVCQLFMTRAAINVCGHVTERKNPGTGFPCGLVAF